MLLAQTQGTPQQHGLSSNNFTIMTNTHCLGMAGLFYVIRSSESPWEMYPVLEKTKAGKLMLSQQNAALELANSNLYS